MTTPAQRELMRWLVAKGHTSEVSGGTLVDMYAERWEREQEEWLRGHHTTARRHAWRRAGGRALSLAEEAGLVVRTAWHWGVPYYRLTPVGLEVGRHQEALEALP